MPSEKFEIVFYLSASGAECRVEYDAKESYDAARAILDARLDASPVARDGKPALHTVFYYIEEHQSEVFEQCMRDIQQGA